MNMYHELTQDLYSMIYPTALEFHRSYINECI